MPKAGTNPARKHGVFSRGQNDLDCCQNTSGKVSFARQSEQSESPGTAQMFPFTPYRRLPKPLFGVLIIIDPTNPSIQFLKELSGRENGQRRRVGHFRKLQPCGYFAVMSGGLKERL